MTPVLSSIALLSMLAGGCQDSAVTETRSLVRALGSPGTDHRSVLRRLAEQPQLAAAELVANLKVIEPRVLVPQAADQVESHNVIWTLRALQYITGGLRFTASTSEKFGSTAEELRRAHLLQVYSGDPSRLTFYATWMSRETTYMAPRDSQAAVIQQWREWSRDEALIHNYAPARALEDWYF